MFPRLRHHAFVRRDDQRQHVDAVRAGKHVLNETLVTGNVDETDAEIFELEIGEAEVDGDTAALFFWQAVRIRARERAYKRTLSVVNMAGRPDDERRHFSTQFCLAMTSS